MTVNTQLLTWLPVRPSVARIEEGVLRCREEDENKLVFVIDWEDRFLCQYFQSKQSRETEGFTLRERSQSQRNQC